MRGFLVVLAAFVMSACGNPNDVVFGPDPIGQVAGADSQFAHLTDEEHALLLDYLSHADTHASHGDERKAVTGKTLGAVLQEAHGWRHRHPTAHVGRSNEERSASAEREPTL
ncbi:hypothetical protein [Methyloversatilis sp.]|uniref:hypothetical protein n=1 Tax=Methyloversatilis sp. TaxID=2569862 RepID=UPI003D26EC2F